MSDPFGSEGAASVGGVLSGARAGPGELRARLATVGIDNALRLAAVGGQLAVLLFLVREFRIENAVFHDRIFPLALGGAVVHHFLPRRLRLGFFALLSMMSVSLVFGLEQGAWILGIGATLIAFCHLPIPFAARLTLLVSVGLCLAAMRAGRVPTPFNGVIWPILGSMFMFRLIAYLYDLRHLKERTTWNQRFAYFFCLPNVVFPLFPVVDFGTFRRTYYDKPAADIYQQGVHWIARGLTHIVLYRLVYQYATLSPAEVVDTSTLLRYILANFALYLRVSGQFHLIVGILHLFGFRLPETHRFFYLASSLTDFWRRINIYWKDFMMKVFYYPAHFRLRRYGDTIALIGSTLVVFVATWFFHSYQWFWLLGTWLWSLTDTLFWGILAVGLVSNSLLELRRGRRRSLGGKIAWSWKAGARVGVSTAATFTFIALLWSLWTSPTLPEWMALMGKATFDPAGIALVVSVLAIVSAAAIVVDRARPANPLAALRPPSASASLLAIVPLGALYAAGEPSLRQHLPRQAVDAVRDVRLARLNKRDSESLQRGYYEKIVGVDRFNGELWRVYSLRPKTWTRLADIGAVRESGDARLDELVPSSRFDFHGTTLTINRHGMRDQEYPVAKPAGTVRVAVLGQSYVLGSGVSDGESFEALVEARLGRNRTPGDGPRVELLNFGLPSAAAFQQLALLQSRLVDRFSPDVLLYVCHINEYLHVSDYFTRYLSRFGPYPDARIRSLMDSAGVAPGMAREEMQRRLAPHRLRILQFVFSEIAATARAQGMRPVLALIPTPLDNREGSVGDMSRAGEAAGFSVVDMTDVYRGHDENTLIVADWDRHPNVKGHRVIADRLYAELLERPELFVPSGGPAPYSTSTRLEKP
jgi:D-alanyl-lipoteichoic acid acyltransferase DltB (MBOAT superfamily)